MASLLNIAVVAGSIYCMIWFIWKKIVIKKCKSDRLLTGKTVIVTGANCGIGKVTAQELAKRKARVILACRDTSKAASAVKEIRKVTENGELIIKKVDLASLASVREFCDEILKEERHIDVLIHNAAISQHPYMLTEDGLEIHMAVNHFAIFLMTNLLLERMKESSPSRIIFVNATLHKMGKLDLNIMNGKRFFNYANSKLANVYFARELHNRIKGTGVSVYTLHPGVVKTELSRNLVLPIRRFLRGSPIGWLLRTPLEGCQTVLHCAVSEELEGVSGKYYNNCQEEEWSSISSDDATRIKLWEISETMTKSTSSL